MNWRAFLSGAVIAGIVLLSGFDTPREANAANQVVIYLKANAGKGNQTFTIPGDWNSSTNTIECIGSGGTGISNLGGGGGAYAKISNLSLTGGGTATYAIGASATTTTNTGMYRETYFNSTASSTASISCAFGRNGGNGGATANSTGTTKFAGGNPGNKGGGGAAGPHGAGGNGSFGNGGNGDAGFGGAGGSAAQGSGGEEEGFSCSDGAFGTEYSSGVSTEADDVGSGGGGGGGAVPGFNAACWGGNYGAGGGGGSPVGPGSQGVIIILYTPATSGFTGSLAKFSIQGGRVLIRGGRVLIK